MYWSTGHHSWDPLHTHTHTPIVYENCNHAVPTEKTAFCKEPIDLWLAHYNKM